jgi:hypothetical protein
MTFRRFLCVAVVATGASIASSCLSPTLPLPPPDPPSDIAQDVATGEWQVSGDCVPGATVLVVNNTTGRGAVVEDLDQSGSYSVAIAGKACDPASVTQMLNVDGSEESGGPTPFVLAPVSDAMPTTTDCGSQ